MLLSRKTSYKRGSIMKKILFDDNKNIISNRLRAFREEAGISQAQLAAQMQTLGVSIDQQMISRIEKNLRQVTDYELACFCKLLSVRVEDMLSDFYNNY